MDALRLLALPAQDHHASRFGLVQRTNASAVRRWHEQFADINNGVRPPLKAQAEREEIGWGTS